MSEDQRIVSIVAWCKANPGKKAAVCTDDEPGKGERYIRKLRAACPELVISEIQKGPVPGVVTIQVSLP